MMSPPSDVKKELATRLPPAPVFEDPEASGLLGDASRNESPADPEAWADWESAPPQAPTSELIAELLAAPTTPASAAADDEPAWLSSAARSLSQHSGTLHVDAQRVTTRSRDAGGASSSWNWDEFEAHPGTASKARRPRGAAAAAARRRRRRAGAAAAARRRRGAVGVRALLGLLPVLPPRVPLAPRARRVPLRSRHRRRRARVHEARASR